MLALDIVTPADSAVLRRRYLVTASVVTFTTGADLQHLITALQAAAARKRA